MIDVRELRIGNYLFMRENIVAIGGIPNRMCLLIPGQEYAVDLEQFEPITLTEELLLKCGFENIHGELSLIIVPCLSWAQISI